MQVTLFCHVLTDRSDRAIKRFIAINHIQNISLCLNNICGCTVYNYFAYINTHIGYVHLRKKYYLYIKYLYTI